MGLEFLRPQLLTAGIKEKTRRGKIKGEKEKIKQKKEDKEDNEEEE